MVIVPQQSREAMQARLVRLPLLVEIMIDRRGVIEKMGRCYSSSRDAQNPKVPRPPTGVEIVAYSAYSAESERRRHL